jgi:hypothetical protein
VRRCMVGRGPPAPHDRPYGQCRLGAAQGRGRGARARVAHAHVATRGACAEPWPGNWRPSDSAAHVHLCDRRRRCVRVPPVPAVTTRRTCTCATGGGGAAVRRRAAVGQSCSAGVYPCVVPCACSTCRTELFGGGGRRALVSAYGTCVCAAKGLLTCLVSVSGTCTCRHVHLACTAPVRQAPVSAVYVS